MCDPFITLKLSYYIISISFTYNNATAITIGKLYYRVKSNILIFTRNAWLQDNRGSEFKEPLKTTCRWKSKAK